MIDGGGLPGKFEFRRVYTRTRPRSAGSDQCQPQGPAPVGGLASEATLVADSTPPSLPAGNASLHGVAPPDRDVDSVHALIEWVLEDQPNE